MKTFYVIFLCFFSTISTDDVFQTETCAPTENCDCYVDFEEIEYQCPKNVDDKIVVHKTPETLKIECWDIKNFENKLPNVTFTELTELIISQCPIRNDLLKLFINEEIFSVEMENSIIYENIIDNLSNINRLTLKSNQIAQINLFENLKELRYLNVENSNFNLNLIENLTSLTELNLSFNNITTLPNLDNFQNLISLHLSNNQIASIENNFENLSNLKLLALDFNSIKNLHQLAFKKLKNVIVVDLSFNNIESIKKETFKGLNSLKYLFLNYNPNLIIENYAFSNLKSLDTISLSNSNISDLPEDIFKNSSNLVKISLNHNNLRFLPTKIFDGLIKLEKLHLHNNKFKNFQENLFVSLSNLEQLFLQNNLLKTIEDFVLKNLTKILEIDMSNNVIEKISNRAFRDAKNLRSINLSKNRYSGIDMVDGNFLIMGPFSFCTNLEEIDLSHNAIKDLIDDLLIYPRRIRKIDLSHNLISTLELTSLLKTGNRNMLINLENNLIENINVDILPEHLEETEEMEEPQLSKISISNNPLKCDCFNFDLFHLLSGEQSDLLGLTFDHENLKCSKPDALKDVRFSSLSASDLICPLSEIVNVENCTDSNCTCSWRPFDRAILADCASGKIKRFPKFFDFTLAFDRIEIDLEDNELEKLTDEIGLKNVSKLNLARNKISEISYISLDIKVLDLRFNNIEKIDAEVFKSTSLERVYVGHNPWRCDCDLLNFTQFLRENTAMMDVADIKCNQSQKLLINLQLNEMCEEDLYVWLTFACALVMFLCVLSILTAFYYKNQEEIKVWLYSKNACLPFIFEEDLDKNKIYDVFVSYSNHDEEFVFENIVGRLEKGDKYKVCIHYRDWIPGELISEQIVRSVKTSKRTLVILSPNFLRSIWGIMEFRTAHLEAIREKRCRVVLVILGDVDLDKLDDELKVYVNANTYLRWGDKYFWEKLFYALPHKRIIDV